MCENYGPGTVISHAKPIDPDNVIASPAARKAGWLIPVRWDAAEWGVVDVIEAALTLVEEREPSIETYKGRRP